MPSPLSRRLASVLTALLAATLLPTPTPAGAAPPGAAPADRLQPAARQALTGGRTADLIVEFTERADLSAARGLRSHGQRTGYGRSALAAVAERSQRDVRDLLTARKVRHQPLWIVNAVHVTGADAKLAAELARRPEVRTVRTARTFAAPKPTPTRTAAAAAGVEWNIERIRANRVWSEYDIRGEGIVVANIDTGVQYDHPALVRQYRGNLGDGRMDHRFNWYDPYGDCSGEPCDTSGHGTHTMGAMVGDDGEGNQVGVAPGARWVAARGCFADGCRELALLLAGEWVMAPFDDTLQFRPDLAPHIVNNSWGSDVGGDPFFQDVVRRWTEVGIMPVFAAGNAGPDCGSAGSPGDYPLSFAVAAFGSDNAIADFSSRGAAGAAEVKPDIAAPGVAIRSTVPGSRFSSYDGTSMAAPHVAGSVALLWSAAPELIGDVAATRALLAGAAIETADLSCGGTAADNPVWGEGRLDAYAAVTAAPRGPRGTLTGVVRSTAGQPVSDALVRITGGNRTERVTRTDATGRYTVTAPPDDYRLTVAAFGFTEGGTSIRITADATTTGDLTVNALPRHTIRGVVRDPGGTGAPGIAVRLLATPLPTIPTGDDGSYRIDDVPVGSYRLTFGSGRCLTAGSRWVTVDGDETVDLEPPAEVDAQGYQCNGTDAGYVAGTDVLPLTGDDESLRVTLPFTMPFYGRYQSSAWIATNGFLSFDRAADNSINREVPNPSIPNAAIFGFWDDLVVDAQASVRTASFGSAPDRRFVVEWRNVTFYDEPERVSFSIEMFESGDVVVHYGDLSAGALARGAGASVGVENQAGTVGLEYSRDVAALRPHTAIAFRAAGAIHGTVTKPDGSPADGALVSATTGDSAAVTTTTATDGIYLLHLPLGTYQVEVTLATFGVHRSTVALDTSGARVVHDVRLALNERVVSGVIRDSLGAPVRGARVRLQHPRFTTPAVTTGGDGAYRFEKVPENDTATYVYASVDGCQRDGRLYLPEIIGGDVVGDVTVVAPTGVVDGADSYGYQCLLGGVEQSFATTPVAVDTAAGPTAVALPFPFRLYDESYSTAYVSAYGYLTFLPATYQSGSNSTLPTTVSHQPDAAVYGFWDGLTLDATSRVSFGTAGSAPNRRVMVSWQNVLLGDAARASFDIVLHESGRIDIQHRALPDTPAGRGRSATVGIEDESSDQAHEYLYMDERLRSGQSIRYLPPGTVTGLVTDAVTGAPVAGATLEFLRLDDVEEQVTTDAAGRYTLRAPLGTYAVRVLRTGWFGADGQVTLDLPFGTVHRNFALDAVG
ncbi:hypothetical protein GCM10022225_37320 [Plantactinospora mayteni]|uniref:alpha-amylase n=1 Tax=Plantactinospora mayteni TaxID=566021 RepID=A0ABQ4EM54_9ACTN|nr:carboxypeptidase regulatory-like domain-containing protein [Plantactinospora mayteni]GIG95312.1 hypothetical protein Pma05_18850 [Plantactinospora mayteni]